MPPLSAYVAARADHQDLKGKREMLKLWENPMLSVEARLETASGEIDRLRGLLEAAEHMCHERGRTIIDLLEILRDWEPDNASGEERQKIMQAMYQVGILNDPLATISAMQKKQNGHCSKGEQCVCGGDTPSVRAGCVNWIAN